MDLADRLDFLLKLFNTNMSKLARAVSVDPSLISKWRSGARKFSEDSPHLVAIVNYFVDSRFFDARKDSLISELERLKLPIGNLNSKKSFEKVLIQYLTPAFHERNLYGNDKQQKINGETTGIPREYEVFEGVEGKRCAVVKFLHAVIASSSPLELLLFSQEEMGWLVEDKAFFLQWAALLGEVVARGHRIKIIHHVNRDPSQITSVIEQWLPLHLTGRIEAWFLPKYTPVAIKTTIFAAKGVSAIAAAAPGNKGEADYNFYYTDPIMVKVIEEMFESVLASAKKLCNSFKNINASSYLECVSEIEKQPGDSVSFSASVSSVFMPASLYEKAISRIVMDDAEKQKSSRMHSERVGTFRGVLTLHKHIHIEFKHDLLNQSFPFTSSEFFKPDIRLNTQEITYYIENIIKYMKLYDHFEYIIVDKCLPEKFKDIHFFMKKEKGVVITSDKYPEYEPMIMTFTEPTVLNAFEAYVVSNIEGIPPVIRSKERNIKLLEERLSRLKGHQR